MHRTNREKRCKGRVVLYTMVSSGQRGGAKNIKNILLDLYIIMCAVGAHHREV